MSYPLSRYTVYHTSLMCDACDIELMEMGGQTGVNVIVYVIEEHEKEAHDT